MPSAYAASKFGLRAFADSLRTEEMGNGVRVTTVFPRQGHYAHDPESLKAFPAADITLDKIGDLLACDLDAFLGNSEGGQS